MSKSLLQSLPFEKWFREQTEDDKDTMLLAALERLHELEEVRFVAPDEEQNGEVYWRSCGEDLRIPF